MGGKGGNVPHRVGYLKERIVSLENVCAAADEYNRARPRWLRKRFTIEWLNDIATDLANDRFVWDEPRRKDIYEGGKLRHLRIPSLRSSIAQSAIFRVLNPIIDARLPDMSYSSRRGRGGHALARKVSRFVRTKGDDAKFCLYFDIRKYYDHIKIDRAVECLSRVIKDKWVLKEVAAMFANIGSPGLPIGYIGAHQLANLYVADIFRKLRKREKSVRFGSIYMDNFTFLGRFKNPLHRLRKYAAEVLGSIGLEIKKDWQVFPTKDRGVRVGGLIIFRRGTPRLYKRINHRTMRNFDKAFSRPSKKHLDSLSSRYGWYLASNRKHIYFDKAKKEKQKCEQYIAQLVLASFS